MARVLSKETGTKTHLYSHGDTFSPCFTDVKPREFILFNDTDISAFVGAIPTANTDSHHSHNTVFLSEVLSILLTLCLRLLVLSTVRCKQLVAYVVKP